MPILRRLLAVGLALLLSGCLFDGFTVPDAYRPEHKTLAEPVKDGAVYALSASPSQPAVHVRFIRVGPNRFAMEQFVDGGKGEAPQLIVQSTTFVPLADGWHALHWRMPVEPYKQGYHLVRFDQGGMRIAEVSARAERMLELARLADFKPSLNTFSSGIEIKPASADKVIDFMKLAVATPELASKTLSAAKAVPAPLARMAYQAVGSHITRLEPNAEIDPGQAAHMLAYFRALHEQGNVWGTFGLARFHANGWGTRQDGKAARAHAEAAIAGGVPQANQVLGAILYLGIGEAPDPARAIPYLRLAAEADVPAAFSLLGFAYRDGQGVEKDAAASRRWFERAVDAGRPEAWLPLAWYLVRDNKPESTERARALIDQGMKKRQAEAFFLRGVIASQGGGGADLRDTFGFWMTAAELGHEESQYRVGVMLLDGLGTPKHPAHGEYWLRRAAQAGHDNAGETVQRLKLPPQLKIPAIPAWLDRNYADEEKDWREKPRIRPVVRYHGATPLRVPGARTLRTVELRHLLAGKAPLLVIDVSNAESVPGAIRLERFGQDRPEAGRKEKTQQVLDGLTGGDRNRPLVFLCVSAECWLSYNAALYAIEAGYRDVLWYRGGYTSWVKAGQKVEPVRVVAW